MLAQRIALQASHEEPLRDDVEGFIVPRMDCNDAVRQVIVEFRGQYTYYLYSLDIGIM